MSQDAAPEQGKIITPSAVTDAATAIQRESDKRFLSMLERAAIVAWLRNLKDVEFEYAADAIERGEHLK